MAGMCVWYFSILFCDEENRIIYDGKFVLCNHLGGTLRCLKQLGGVKLWFKQDSALCSPASLAKIRLAWGLASTSFGPDVRAFPISALPGSQVCHPRLSPPYAWCHIMSALPWPACLQATYLLCCSVQENIVSPLKVGTRLWEGQRESESTKNVRLEKRKWLWHRYGQKYEKDKHGWKPERRGDWSKEER